MKKLFVLTALAAASAATFAQTNVQVYGIVDAGVSHVSGLAGGSRTFLVSGMMEGTRLGVRGSEDLGGGYRALFTLENRSEVDTGGISNRPPSGSQLPDRLSQGRYLIPNFALLPALNQAQIQGAITQVASAIGASVGVNVAGNFWDRQIYVGLVTPVGAVLAGRQYTPAYEVSAAFDTLGTQSSLAAGQVASFPPSVDIRVSNALQYRIQLGGLTASAMYALGEGSATTGRLFGAMAQYKASGWSVGVGHNTRKNENDQKSLTSTVAGGTLDIGPGTAYLQVATIKDDNPTGLNPVRAQLGAAGALIAAAFTEGLKQDGQLVHVGYKLTTGPHTIYTAYSQFNDKREINADTTSYGVAYTYALSKRTDINAVLTQFINKGTGQAAPGQAGFIGGVTESAGKDSNNVAVGIRHRF